MPKRLLLTNLWAFLPFFISALLLLLLGSLSYAQAPVNDNCSNAVTLTSATSFSATTGTTVGATQSLDAIMCGGFTTSADDDVWYKFTAVATTHTVTVVGSASLDLVIDVRSGACNGTNIACADANADGGTEMVNLSGLTIGTTYLVRVYGWANRGTFTIGITHSGPANDECANAVTLTSGGSCTPTNGTTVSATQSLAAITCNTATGTADDDVWYQFTAVATTHIVTVVGAAGFNPIIDVRSGACNGTNITCADATTSGGTETATLSGLTLGTTYLVRVYSFGDLLSNRGEFTICVTHTAPVNDECANAVTLTSGGSCTPTNGTTVSATQSLAAITCNTATGTADDDVWYQFTAVVTTHIVTVVGAAGFNPIIDVRSGACSGTNLACADATANGGTEIISLSDLTIGSTYFVRVYGFGDLTSDRGTFTICVTHTPPANDDCANAVTLTPGISCTATAGTTVGATQSLAAITCNSKTGTADDDVWYQFTAAATTQIITVVGSPGFDPVVDIRVGACNGSNGACSDGNLQGGTEKIIISGFVIGTVYYIRIYGAGSTIASRGTFTICVENPPANDDCANAVTLTSSTSCSATAGTTVNASQSLPAITCSTFTGTANDDVWYKFTAVATTHIVRVVGGTGFDPVIDVRSGACNGTNIACADATSDGGTETVNVSGLALGTTYYVRVYGFGSALSSRGSFTICVTHSTCSETLTITEPITSGTVVKEALQLTATNQVTGGTVTYRGAQSVTLQPGFSAITGAGTLFQAMIAGCL